MEKIPNCTGKYFVAPSSLEVIALLAARPLFKKTHDE
jgi:hypothetical protein